jgi:extracellular factor (EF) 3-hydroxypalmitic acid methyl ester biosynthesis protein
VLCAPFPHRAYYKPLGYAGDFEMVNMMARNAREGASLYGVAVNSWFLAQPPAEAHRNRIVNLVQHLHDEAVRVRSRGRPLRVFNVACGPAEETRRFLQQHAISSQAEFTLLDFSAETLDYTRSMLETEAQRRGRASKFEFVKKSVHHLIKESVRGARTAQTGQFDLVYCAGLFDYLTDEVCRRLMNLMYDWLAPGGLLLATNVETGNPLRYGMEHLLDWHLVYRNGGDMLRIAPDAPAAEVQPTIEKTSFNVFLEVRKPGHA